MSNPLWTLCGAHPRAPRREITDTSMSPFSLQVGLGAYGVAWLLSPAARGLTARGPSPGGAEYPLPLTVPDLVRLAADFGFRRLQLADNSPVEVLSATEWREVLRVADERQVALEMGCGLEAVNGSNSRPGSES